MPKIQTVTKKSNQFEEKLIANRADFLVTFLTVSLVGVECTVGFDGLRANFWASIKGSL